MSEPHRTINRSSSREIHERRVFIRRVKGSDKAELVKLAQASQNLHMPWITAPLTPHMFRVYLKRTQRDDAEGFVCCLKTTNEIIGVINLNDIVKGAFQSANLSYYVHSKYQGKGLMTEALQLVMAFAFEILGLHRLEAAIQPHNDPSKNLVKRCGFVMEGLARDFLFIDGRWRDHERWARTDGRNTMTR